MREQACCFTGHRVIDGGDLTKLVRLLETTIEQLIQQGITEYYCGGACGYDLLAGAAVTRLRKRYPAVKLLMILPCHGQESKWAEVYKQAYVRLLAAADSVEYVSETYYDGVMLERNKRLVDHSSYCVAYMKYKRTGTSQTVRLAREHGLTVINLAE